MSKEIMKPRQSLTKNTTRITRANALAQTLQIDLDIVAIVVVVVGGECLVDERAAGNGAQSEAAALIF